MGINMNDTITDEEKDRITRITLQYLVPIMAQYEVTDLNSVAALTAAFQAGIKFSVKEMKEVGHDEY